MKTEKENSIKIWNPTNPAFDPNEPMQVGGQAIIEGVMMRAKGTIATAVRRPDGTIAVHKEAFRSFAERHPKWNVPVLRGAVGLIEMMYIGIKTLNYSAEVALGEPDPDDKGKKSAVPIAATLVVALLLGVGVFFFIPLFVATIFFKVEQQPLLFNLVAGAIRIIILIGYLYSISLMKDIRRLFQYHGAEHKAVYTFEQNAPLEIPSAMTFTRFHPRCGTSFVLLVMFLSIFFFSLLDSVVLLFVHSLNLPLRLATHIPFIPVVGGLSYEVLKFSAKHASTRLGRILVAPGLWLQKITTKEPDESQMEVSLAAIRAALRLDEESVQEKSPSIAVG
ncbi:MAG TPA: DUF1385 domain-containing protein [Bacteroidota bacterium]|nr:DUF1385 domain-containing protein [Bacteroidota bacterium]